LDSLPPNPYLAATDDEAGGPPLATIATPVEVARRPKVWPVPVILLASLAIYLFSSVLALVVAAVAVHGRITASMFGDIGFITSLTQSRVGFPFIVVIPQVAMIIPPVIAAAFSPMGIRRRLHLVRGHWPVWVWCLAAIATPLIGMISSIVVGLFMEDSESLVEMSKVFRDLANDGFMLPLAFLIGATPGICEEILFRGYVQSRFVGILVTSLLFAAFHMDLVHSTAVFALGVWLGWVSWQSGSIFPAMLAHFVNNVTSVFAVALGPEPGSTDVSLGVVFAMVAVFFLGSGAFFATLASAWRYRPSSDILANDRSEPGPELSLPPVDIQNPSLPS
jgi:uncharacterized protein